MAAFAKQPSAPLFIVSAPVVALRSNTTSVLLAWPSAYALLPSGLTCRLVTASSTPEFTVHDWLAIAALA